MFVILFSLVDQKSFDTVRGYRDEAMDVCPGVPIILVGTKTDLRDDQETIEQLKAEGLAPITTERGLKMSEEIEAVKYMEVSALNMTGLDELFIEVARAAVATKKGSCALS